MTLNNLFDAALENPGQMVGREFEANRDVKVSMPQATSDKSQRMAQIRKTRLRAKAARMLKHHGLTPEVQQMLTLLHS